MKEKTREKTKITEGEGTREKCSHRERRKQEGKCEKIRKKKKTKSKVKYRHKKNKRKQKRKKNPNHFPRSDFNKSFYLKKVNEKILVKKNQNKHSLDFVCFILLISHSNNQIWIEIFDFSLFIMLLGIEKKIVCIWSAKVSISLANKNKLIKLFFYIR